MTTSVLLTQSDYIKAIDEAKKHPLWESYKVKQRGFRLKTNALKDVLVEVYFTTKSKSERVNVDVFENLLRSFEGFDYPAQITCGKISLEK